MRLIAKDSWEEWIHEWENVQVEWEGGRLVSSIFSVTDQSMIYWLAENERSSWIIINFGLQSTAVPNQNVAYCWFLNQRRWSSFILNLFKMILNPSLMNIDFAYHWETPNAYSSWLKYTIIALDIFVALIFFLFMFFSVLRCSGMRCSNYTFRQRDTIKK